ncbi:hypothetical protein [Ideonella sp. A 288]|uniref:hypothetical protein n=1 Tax=Ideonella sp. A 288 TaxID=1962181 RepID=UPI001186A35B|nr:hypothetical protein [Ideonella sp. A 288]
MQARKHIVAARPDPVAGLSRGWTMPLEGARRAAIGLLTLPFDTARVRYGAAVELGLVHRSMLAGAAFERDLAAWEHFTLGAWARRV